MKVLVFGSRGRLGREIVDRLLVDRHEVAASTREDCDLVQAADIPRLILEDSPDVVINASAKNGLEACAQRPFEAMQVNASAPAAMAAACKIRGALLITFSTDYVFSGDPMGLYENTPTKPWGVYGRTKLWGEEAVSWCAGSHFVFRLSSLYGRDLAGVLEPIKQVQRGLGKSAASPVKVLHQICAPTSTKLVADVVAHLLAKHDHEDWRRLSGVYHLATKPRRSGESGVSKLAFTRVLLNSYHGFLASGADWHVAEGSLPEPRPVYSVLKTGKFEDAFDFRLPTWAEALREMLPLLPQPEKAATV